MEANDRVRASRLGVAALAGLVAIGALGAAPARAHGVLLVDVDVPATVRVNGVRVGETSVDAPVLVLADAPAGRLEIEATGLATGFSDVRRTQVPSSGAMVVPLMVRTGTRGPLGGVEVAAEPGSPTIAATRLTEGIAPPTIRTRVEPAYPAAARAAGLSGDIVLECVVDGAGDVTVTRVLKSVAGLDGPAVEAVSRWQYEPATRDGEPLAVLLMVRLTFNS